jgi:HK97 family phage portal protein
MGVASWARGLFNRESRDGQPKSSRLYYFGKTAAGVRVTPDTALQNSVVWACIRYLSSTVAQLPWRVMKDVAGGSEKMNAHPVDWLLWKRPCAEMGSFSWRQTMLGWALRHGNAYAEIERDMRGVPIALWPLHPDRVVVRRADDGALVYEVWNPSGNVFIEAMDIFHLRGFGDGPVGFNVVEYAAQSIGWAQATEIFGSSYFSEGMNPSGIVKVPATTTLDVDGQEELRKEIDRVYAGPKGKRTAILDGGIDFIKVAYNPDESQFIETRQHQVEEICRWFGVPPHKVMHLLRATFSNIEHQSIEVVVDSVTPWIKGLEEEADYKMFGNNRQGYFTKIDTRALLRGDHASRGEYYAKLHGVGALSTNEIRSLEDFNNIGVDGDRRFVSTNLQPLDAPMPAEGGSSNRVDLTDPVALATALRLN